MNSTLKYLLPIIAILTTADLMASSDTEDTQEYRPTETAKADPWQTARLYTRTILAQILREELAQEVSQIPGTDHDSAIARFNLERKYDQDIRILRIEAMIPTINEMIKKALAHEEVTYRNIEIDDQIRSALSEPDLLAKILLPPPQ